MAGCHWEQAGATHTARTVWQLQQHYLGLAYYKTNHQTDSMFTQKKQTTHSSPFYSGIHYRPGAETTCHRRLSDVNARHIICVKAEVGEELEALSNGTA